jgi:hypothetical protein
VGEHLGVTSHLYGSAAREVDRLRAGFVRFFAPCTPWAHAEQLSPIQAPAVRDKSVRPA